MFYWYDYLILVSTLVVSGSVGVYHGCFGTKQKTIREYIFAGKMMKALPIGLSITVSHFSAATVIGIPADTYSYGINFMWSFLALILMAVVVCTVFLPIFFKLQVTSVYEYLQYRFDGKTRLLTLATSILSITLFLPGIIYSSSLFFSTGWNVHLVSLISCGVCIFYTTIGGLKTVIWTDIFQFAVIAASLLNLFIILFQKIGISTVWEKANEGDRLDLFDFNFDLTRRDSFWSMIFGYGTSLVCLIGVQQTAVQKLLALPSYDQWIWSVVYFVITYGLVNASCVLIGLGIYAKYASCDPVLNGTITKRDQLLPHFMMDMSGNIPGVFGLFTAAIFSATMSSVSSCLNSTASVVYKDFVCVFFKTSDNDSSSKTLKLIVVLQGVIAILISILMENLGEIMSIMFSIVSLGVGPSLGVFTLGIMFPQANASGAFYGLCAGIISVAAIMFPAKYYQMQGAFRYSQKNFSAEGCGAFANATSILTPKAPVSPYVLFQISFYFYSILSAVVTLVIGLAVSYITRKNCSLMDDNLLSPYAVWFGKRHQVNHNKRNDKEGESLEFLDLKNNVK